MDNRTVDSLKATDIQVLPDPVRRWLPATEAQKKALDSDADILLFGGSVGSLKTATMLVDLIQERRFAFMNSYFFRKTYPAMEDAMQQASQLFPQTGAVSCGTYNGQVQTWKWPSGAMFRFRQLANQKDVDNSYGKQMSALGFDESTHFPENTVRQMIVRNRSTDPGLKIRVRLGTNPGNIGATWHMKMFFNGVCPHCEPQNAPREGELRWDGAWPSDGTPFKDELTGHKLSLTYILGKLRDHSLLGSTYAARVRMQSPTTAKALLEGCWRQFEGQYFDCWDYETMTVPVQSIPQNYWQAWWTGSDYGYSGSSAASCLFTRAEDGQIYLVAEYPTDLAVTYRENVKTFAQHVYEAFAKKDPGQEQARNIAGMYLGPDSWNDRGDEHTLAGQMNDILEPHGLEFIRANNDRAGGAQLLYVALQSGLLKISRSCTNVISALESRLKDPKEPVKVWKVVDDPLDDIFDSARYGLYSYLEAERKPVANRIAERLKQIVATRDPMAMTSAMINYNRIKKAEEDEDSDEPVYVGGNARRRLAQSNQKH